MTIIGNPGVDKNDFELWSFAVSAINGCGMCMDAHEAELKKHGVSNVQIQTALRIAAVVNAVSRVVAAA
jgi:alkyl hydroperoxide reductase subunit D